MNRERLKYTIYTQTCHRHINTEHTDLPLIRLIAEVFRVYTFSWGGRQLKTDCTPALAADLLFPARRPSVFLIDLLCPSPPPLLHIGSPIPCYPLFPTILCLAAAGIFYPRRQRPKSIVPFDASQDQEREIGAGQLGRRGFSGLDERAADVREVEGQRWMRRRPEALAGEGRVAQWPCWAAAARTKPFRTAI